MVLLAGFFLAACATPGTTPVFADVKISAKGPDTLVQVDTTRILLSGQSWQEDPTEFKLQIGGPSGSGYTPDPRVRPGQPGFVQSTYFGNDRAELLVGAWRLQLTDLGEQFRVESGAYSYRVRKGKGMRLNADARDSLPGGPAPADAPLERERISDIPPAVSDK
jgi:hypothetical protein